MLDERLRLVRGSYLARRCHRCERDTKFPDDLPPATELHCAHCGAVFFLHENDLEAAADLKDRVLARMAS